MLIEQLKKVREKIKSFQNNAFFSEKERLEMSKAKSEKKPVQVESL